MAIKKDDLISRLRDHSDVLLGIYTSKVSYRLCMPHTDGTGTPTEHVHYGTVRKLIESGQVEECELPKTYLAFACIAYRWADKTA